MKRGTVKKKESSLLTLWMPEKLFPLLDQGVRKNDTDRVRFKVAAIREKLARNGIVISEESIWKPDHKQHCECCEAAKRDEWRVRGANLRMQMRRHDLTYRELLIVELILDKTYEAGKKSSVVMALPLRYFDGFDRH